jgi:hypothetical protein
MYEIWAFLMLLVWAAIIFGVFYFILYIFGVAIFEDLLGGIFKKIQARREREEDHYIY